MFSNIFPITVLLTLGRPQIFSGKPRSITLGIVVYNLLHLLTGFGLLIKPIKGYSQLVDGIRRLTVVRITGCNNGEGLTRLLKLRFDQIHLTQPIVRIDRKIAFGILIYEFINTADGFVVFFLAMNEILNGGVRLPLLCFRLTILTYSCRLTLSGVAASCCLGL